ncbi:MAG: YjbH domain-containing protein [Ignavibacteriaceae bacterium]|jgi:hypothetical protein|nr:YjbH domain-containing protein [Ignavibacteriaceae bacterium]MCW8817660.1 YjbH domain-containing protein [Ignavibacteriaceae bacterium]MCW8824562.1 YjbH domain-containing protein [Ignavibacteriaceae bacterium]MCW9065372.1 YjbH domain-containing protein [Ignavibacteriaceae bacterium]MCW9095607.1 YjbH domain-containing protein [Ignavibacteriaceae bacterium]
MKKLAINIFSLLLLTAPIYSQGTAGDQAKYEYRYLIDMPTAGILEKGVVGFTTEILPYGVLIAVIEAGVYDNVSIGISYGGSNLIGSGNVNWYKLPGVTIRARLFNETTLLPAIAIGFDSQGKGIYDDADKRYAIKSPGFFGAVSKNFDFLGYMSLHGTVNYSLEGTDGDNFVDVRAGVEKTLGSSFSLLVEYDFALNDNNSNFGSGKGYLNAGLRWSPGTGFTLGFDLRDLLSNKTSTKNAADRSLKIEYIKNIF